MILVVCLFRLSLNLFIGLLLCFNEPPLSFYHFRPWSKTLLKLMIFSSVLEKYLSLWKISSMNENVESVKRYNLWYGNTIDCGFPRPLYIASINQYLGSKVVKVLTGQRRVGKSYVW